MDRFTPAEDPLVDEEARHRTRLGHGQADHCPVPSHGLAVELTSRILAERDSADKGQSAKCRSQPLVLCLTLADPKVTLARLQHCRHHLALGLFETRLDELSGRVALTGLALTTASHGRLPCPHFRRDVHPARG